MNRDDIIRMAREAGATDKTSLGVMQFYVGELEAFAALVAAAEREACARVCEEADNEAFDKTGCPAYGSECAAVIRTRGTTMSKIKGDINREMLGYAGDD